MAASAGSRIGQALDKLRDGVTPPSEIETLRRELAEARADLAATRFNGAADTAPDGDGGTDATPLGGNPTGRAITERRPVPIDLADVAGLSAPKRAAVRVYGGLTTLSAPMISRERGVGSLVVARRSKRPFSGPEIAGLGAFANQAVIAIGKARLFEECVLTPPCGGA